MKFAQSCWTKGLLPVGLLLAVAGCATGGPYERILSTSRNSRPVWIRTTPPASDGYEFYVGRSVAVNVLDERRAMLRAKHDAAYDIAMSIVAEVRGNSTWVDSQHGDEVRGDEYVDTYWDNQIRVLVDQLLSGFRELESYWELWEVSDTVRATGRRESFRRYKYYVLVSFPQAELERCREAVKKNGRIGSTSS